MLTIYHTVQNKRQNRTKHVIKSYENFALCVYTMVTVSSMTVVYCIYV